MALPSDPSREQIWGELAESNYRNGGTNLNRLSEMYDYAFGAGSYSRDAFGGKGTPVVSDNLTIAAGDNRINCEYEVTNDGGLGWTAVAQYWEYTTDLTTANESTQVIQSSGSGTGIFSNDLTGLTNGQRYQVRVFIYNAFNNGQNYPEAQNQGNWAGSVTDIKDDTPQQSQFTTPAINAATVQDFQNGLYVDLSANGNQDGIEFEIKINGNISGYQVNCSAGAGSQTPEYLLENLDAFINSGDTVEVRARSVGSGQAPSNWTHATQSTWFVASHGTLPSCPL